MADKSISNNDTSRQENIVLNGGRHPDCMCMKRIRDIIDIQSAVSEMPVKVESGENLSLYSVSAKARGYGIPAR